MTKAKVEKDEGYLDFLGMGDEKEEKGEKAPDQAEQIAGLMRTIEGLSSTVDNLQQRANMAPAAVAPVVPTEPTFREVSFDDLPDQMSNPEGYASALNTRMAEAVQFNVRAMTQHQAVLAEAQAQGAGRTDQLWDDFQSQYMDKLETNLPEGVDPLPYVEVAAKAVAKRAQRRGVDMDTYMFRGSFMQDVYAEADKVLKPIRGEEEGADGETHPTAAEAEAIRTGGIFGSGGAGEVAEEAEDGEKGSLVSDIREIQMKSGFY